MANINLLPWREEERRAYDKKTHICCVIICLMALMTFFLIECGISENIKYQQLRNDYLRLKISSLVDTIKDIEGLKSKRDSLLSRMTVIQQLQANRAQIVHVFDDLVRQQPKGIYYTKVSREKDVLYVNGVAQSNALVSELMSNFDASDWFDGTVLKRINVVDKRGISNSKFELSMQQQGKKNVQK